MPSSADFRAHRLSRRGVLSGLVAAGGLAIAPRFANAQATDWLHAEDISAMPNTQIRYWFFETPERVALGEKQVEEFHALFPNITVAGRTAPPAVDNEQLLAFIKAGTNSHVHQTVNNEDTWYIRHNLLQPLDELPGFDALWESLDPRDNYTWTDGHVYSLSWYSDPMAMYYNKALVVDAGLDPESPPTTHSEYLKWAEALTKDTNGDGQPDQWFITLPIGEEWWQYEFTHYPYYIAATGGNEVLAKDGKTATFNTPGGWPPTSWSTSFSARGTRRKGRSTSTPSWPASSPRRWKARGSWERSSARRRKASNTSWGRCPSRTTPRTRGIRASSSCAA